MAFLKDRNKQLSPQFSSIATEYMRHGEDLGIRWDIAFFQMLVETGSLKFRGDVRSRQNNFAGLGATGRGARGESFKTVGLGARAHMQHTLMYSGKYVEDPVAERTRKVQQWKVLDKWIKRLPKPVTFTHLTRKWSPTDRGYSNDIKSVADRFFESYCDRPDPQPQLVALARGGKATKTADNKLQTTKGEKLAAAAIERGRKDETPRSSLGGASLAEGLSKSYSNGSASQAPSYKVINNSETERADTPSVTPTLPSENNAGTVKNTAITGAGAAAAIAQPGKCRVWTASYGGGKAVIIKAASDGMTNFTVLDVNKGREDREANAYITAYAKGGTAIAKFDTQDAALDKAFELCPEKNN